MSQNLEKAKEHENNKMWEQALKEYEELYSNDCNNDYILDKIGWCQSRMKKYHCAIKTYEKLIEKEPKKSKWYYTLGYQYYCLKEWEDSIKHFREAIKYYPKYLIVHYRIAYAISENIGTDYNKSNNKINEALNYLKKYETIYSESNEKEKKANKSDYIKVLFLKGKLLITISCINQAIQNLELANSLEKNDLYITYNLSKAYYLNSNFNKAIELLDSLPKKYYIQELKANVLVKLGNYNEALNILKVLLKTRKKDYIYREIAKVYLYLNELDNAYIYGIESIKVNKHNHKNLYLMGAIYYKHNLLVLSNQVLLESIEIKRQKYNSDYKEAQQLLLKVNQVIEKNKHKEDCKTTLRHLETAKKEESRENTRGKISKWLEHKGYGFISDGCKSYFFHINDVDKKVACHIVEEKIVEFYLTDTVKGKKAIIVKINTNCDS